MNWVDLVVLAVIAVSGMIGLFRGMVREVLGLAAWVLAGAVADWFFPEMQDLARHFIANQNIADPVAAGAPFLVVLIVLSLLARLIGSLVLHSVLGGLDRSLGLLYGLARGAALFIAAYIVGGIILPADQWPPPVLEARSLPSIYLGAAWVASALPPGARPIVTAPPSGRLTRSADLLHTTPSGRALAAPPGRP